MLRHAGDVPRSVSRQRRGDGCRSGSAVVIWRRSIVRLGPRPAQLAPTTLRPAPELGKRTGATIRPGLASSSFLRTRRASSAQVGASGLVSAMGEKETTFRKTVQASAERRARYADASRESTGGPRFWARGPRRPSDGGAARARQHPGASGSVPEEAFTPVCARPAHAPPAAETPCRGARGAG